MTQDGTAQAISVRPNLIVGWLRSSLVLTDTMVSGTTPSTIFGLIPAGTNNISQPLNRVSRVQVSTGINGARFLIALILLLMAFLMLNGSMVLMVIVILIAVAALATSYRTELIIADSGGGTQQVSVSPLDKEAVQRFADSVNQRLAAQG
jgi:hypothetical protein